jgi:hypothetical protein
MEGGKNTLKDQIMAIKYIFGNGKRVGKRTDKPYIKSSDLLNYGICCIILEMVGDAGMFCRRGRGEEFRK